MTLHEICQQSRRTACTACFATEGQNCTCGPAGVHYSRVARATAAGRISLEDFGEAIHDDVFSGGDILLDPAVAA